MSTSMRELVKRLYKIIEVNGSSVNVNNIINTIECEFIEKEKQMIIDSVIQTTQDCWTSFSDYAGIGLKFTDKDLQNQKDEAEQYYNEKFN